MSLFQSNMQVDQILLQKSNIRLNNSVCSSLIVEPGVTTESKNINLGQVLLHQTLEMVSLAHKVPPCTTTPPVWLIRGHKKTALYFQANSTPDSVVSSGKS